MIRVTHSIAPDEKELEESFVRSSGPGGQNVRDVMARAGMPGADVSWLQSMQCGIRENFRGCSGGGGNWMRRVVLLGVAALVLSACDPAYNPVMSFGKNVNTASAPLQEFRVYFKEPIQDVYGAVVVAGNKNDLTIVKEDKNNNIAIISYEFSFTKNVWGGQFRVGLDTVGDKTRLTANFYEKSKYVTNSILNPFIEEMKNILSSSGRLSRE